MTLPIWGVVLLVVLAFAAGWVVCRIVGWEIKTIPPMPPWCPPKPSVEREHAVVAAPKPKRVPDLLNKHGANVPVCVLEDATGRVVSVRRAPSPPPSVLRRPHGRGAVTLYRQYAQVGHETRYRAEE